MRAKTVSLLMLVAPLTLLSGCQTAEGSTSTKGDKASPIEAAVAAPSRTPANAARDPYRHPAATLNFFGVRPNMTVVEIWPGGGWYSEILAPLTKDTGTYYAAAAGERGHNGVKKLMTDRPDIYSNIKLAEFPNVSGPKVPDGSVDVVLTFRNVHNWRMGGEDKARQNFKEIYAMLKPGGVLGVVDHRLPEKADTALEEKSGYMKVSSVKAYAEAAGFRFDKASEINTNPRDTHDHPDGVWNLPPTYKAGDTDRAKYQAIGESDRMTLRFVKPAR